MFSQQLEKLCVLLSTIFVHTRLTSNYTEVRHKQY